MVPLKSVLASQFWNQEVESPRSLNAIVHTLPHEPPPLALLRATKLCRSQQLLLMQQFFPLPCTPSLILLDRRNSSPGGLVLDRVIASAGGLKWWATLTGRIRAHKLFSSEQCGNDGEDSAPVAFKGGWKHAKRLLDRSLYALCLRTKVLLTSRTSLSASSELDTLAHLFTSADSVNIDSIEKPWHSRATLRHKLRRHDIILEAACHEKCVDRNARYWNVPQVLSLDLDSECNALGIRYRLGLHHSSGAATESNGGEALPVPWGALPGTRARAALSIEKKTHLWKGKDGPRTLNKPYNLFAGRPQITLSGIIGGILSTSLGLGGRESPTNTLQSSSDNSTMGANSLRYPPVLADIFASIGFIAQFGIFRRPLLDHTKFGARVDIGAASPFLAAIAQSTRLSSLSTELFTTSEAAFPTFALTLQQQVVGPLRARIDSRFSFDPSSFSTLPRMQELTYGFDCPLESSGAAKLVCWYSPTRREGMFEVRVLET